MAIRQTYAHLSETSPRAADWLAIYGSLSVPLRHPLPVRMRGPADEIRTMYLVDATKLSAEVRARLVAHVAERFGVPEAEVLEELDTEHGCPILADDVSVSFDARLVL